MYSHMILRKDTEIDGLMKLKNNLFLYYYENNLFLYYEINLFYTLCLTYTFSFYRKII
jgi:hypothetical protein